MREWGIVATTLLSLWGGCLGTGCTQAFRDAPLDQQLEAFKQATEHLVSLAERTDAAYQAELEYDGEDVEAYLKQSAGLRVPIRIKLGVFGNAKHGAAEMESQGSAVESFVSPAETPHP